MLPADCYKPYWFYLSQYCILLWKNSCKRTLSTNFTASWQYNAAHRSHCRVNFLNIFYHMWYAIVRGIVSIHHLPHSPHLALCDFLALPWIQDSAMGKKFIKNPKVFEAVDAWYKELGKESQAFMFEKWQKLWQKCIHTEVCYFGKEHIKLEDWINVVLWRVILSLLFIAKGTHK